MRLHSFGEEIWSVCDPFRDVAQNLLERNRWWKEGRCGSGKEESIVVSKVKVRKLEDSKDLAWNDES